MRIVKPPAQIFQAECPNCHVVIEYSLSEVSRGYVKCCNCLDYFSHINYSKPVESSREDNECLAEALCNANYRKASEVAEEIFAAIDDIVESWAVEEYSKESGRNIRTSYNGTMIAKCLAELKKKYTESEGTE